MKTVVIMTGGYHPFHAGHYALYNSAKENFPNSDVYVAATDDTKSRPFPFELKKKLALLSGVDSNKFVKVKSPFKADEILDQYDRDDTAVVFVRSEKDRTEQPKPGGVKKDGSPSYFQPYTGKDLKPMSQHGYMHYLPTVEFGPGIRSATEIRDSWPKLNDKQKLAMVLSLYPKTQSDKKLANVVVKMLDSVLDNSTVSEEAAQPAPAPATPPDLSRREINATADEQATLAYIRRHYPEAPSTQAAFIKFVIHSLQHSEEDSISQSKAITSLEKKISDLDKKFRDLKTQLMSSQDSDYISED